MNAEHVPMKRPMPALIHGLPRAEYDATPGMNWSKLKILGRSPAHFRHALMQPVERTEAMVIGNATHVAVFEPEDFRARFAIWDGGARRGKEWTAFQKENRGRDILTQSQADEARIIANAVRNDRHAAKYVSGGRGEVTLRWHRDGLDCKARPDFVANIGAIVDLKTTKDASPAGFGKQVANLDYLSQCAWYADGYALVTGSRLPFKLIAAEKSAPHVVQVHNVTDELLALGRERYATLLEQYAKCAADNHWPGYVDGEIDLVLPRWALPSLEEDGTDGLDFTQTED